MSESEFYTPEQLARVIHSTTGGLAQMRYRGTGPRFVRVTRTTILYRQADVDRWLESRTFERTDQR